MEKVNLWMKRFLVIKIPYFITTATVQKNGENGLEFFFNQKLLQVNLTSTGLQEVSADMVFIGKNGTTKSSKLATSDCYYTGIVFHEKYEIGWASVFMCNDSLVSFHDYNYLYIIIIIKYVFFSVWDFDILETYVPTAADRY